MTYHDAKDPVCTATSGAIELTIQPKMKDLGEFSVRRVLPARKRRMVGPFIFFDHMGSPCAPTLISELPPSPICSRGKSCIEIASVLCSLSIAVRSI